MIEKFQYKITILDAAKNLYIQIMTVKWRTEDIDFTNVQSFFISL
jgi:hypothetical protein